jgi:hypothetical protein
LAICNIVHQDGPDRTSIVWSSDWFENLLSSLKIVNNDGTVSQICIFTFLSWMSTILDPNYTPIVVSLSTLNLFSRNCMRIQDLPTPKLSQKCTGVSNDDVFKQECVA